MRIYREWRSCSLPLLGSSRLTYPLWLSPRIVAQYRQARRQPGPHRVRPEPGQAGKSQALHLVRASAASPFRQPRGVATTLTRLGPLSSPCRAGNVKILRGAWSVELFRILEGFPDLAHDDEVDASSGSLEILNLQMRNWGPRKPIAYRQQAEHLRVKKGRLMRRQPKAQTLAPLAGNRGFESTSLQQGVWCEPDLRGRRCIVDHRSSARDNIDGATKELRSIGVDPA